MKTVINMIAMSAMSMSLTACFNSGGGSGAATAAPETGVLPAPTTPAPTIDRNLAQAMEAAGCTFKEEADGLAVNCNGTEGKIYNGANGAQGIQGLKGDKGDKGDQGVAGAMGAQGLQGQQGVQGLTGATGAQGLQGIQGLKGDKGDQGEQGLQGPAGPAGTSGPQYVLKDSYGTVLTNLEFFAKEVKDTSVSNVARGSNAVYYLRVKGTPYLVVYYSPYLEGTEGTASYVRYADAGANLQYTTSNCTGQAYLAMSRPFIGMYGNTVHKVAFANGEIRLYKSTGPLRNISTTGSRLINSVCTTINNGGLTTAVPAAQITDTFNIPSNFTGELYEDLAQ